MHLDERIQKMENRLIKIIIIFFVCLIFIFLLYLAFDNYCYLVDDETKDSLIIYVIVFFLLSINVMLTFLVIAIIQMIGFTEYQIIIDSNTIKKKMEMEGFEEEDSKYYKKVGISQYVVIEFINENGYEYLRISKSSMKGSIRYKIYKQPLSPKYVNKAYYYTIDLFGKLPDNSFQLITQGR